MKTAFLLLILAFSNEIELYQDVNLEPNEIDLIIFIDDELVTSQVQDFSLKWVKASEIEQATTGEYSVGSLSLNPEIYNKLISTNPSELLEISFNFVRLCPEKVSYHFSKSINAFWLQDDYLIIRVYTTKLSAEEYYIDLHMPSRNLSSAPPKVKKSGIRRRNKCAQ